MQDDGPDDGALTDLPEPAPDEPATEGFERAADGRVVRTRTWFTRRLAQPTCPLCVAGRCVQKVVRYVDLDTCVTIHDERHGD